MTLLALNLATLIVIKISPQYHDDFVSLVYIVMLLAMVYGLRAILWLVLGKYYQLSYIYPLIGVNYVISLLVGYQLFNEALSLQRFIGAFIILIGASLISLTKHKNVINVQ